MFDRYTLLRGRVRFEIPVTNPPFFFFASVYLFFFRSSLKVRSCFHYAPGIRRHNKPPFSLRLPVYIYLHLLCVLRLLSIVRVRFNARRPLVSARVRRLKWKIHRTFMQAIYNVAVRTTTADFPRDSPGPSRAPGSVDRYRRPKMASNRLPLESYTPTQRSRHSRSTFLNIFPVRSSFPAVCRRFYR